MAAQAAIYELCRKETDVTRINLPKTNYYVENSRGQQLHVRTFWPDSSKFMATVVFIHGYGSHGSRPSQSFVSNRLNENGFGYVCLDLTGYGYSQGERALSESLDYLSNDLISLLRLLYSKGGIGCMDTPDAAKKHSFYLMGQSMGASLAVHVGNIIRTEPGLLGKEASSLFAGCLLLAPAIAVKAPGTAIRTVLEYFIVPCFGAYEIPMWMSSSSRDDEAYKRGLKDEAYIRYIINDDINANPAGISWCGSMKFQTASTILKLAETVEANIPRVDFPFLVMHDPADEVASVKGATWLMERSATIAEDKCYVEVLDGRHDLLSNELQFVADTILEWLLAQQNKGK
jgi:alpha-beta hydrolase superfamily lysophospholipase